MANQSKAEPTSGNIVQAMAWRVKYRVDKNGKRTIPILLLGVHKQNRGGPYPGGLRCRSLCESAVTRGFNKEELNHAGVVVEEMPIAAIAGADDVSMSEHNRERNQRPMSFLRHVSLRARMCAMGRCPTVTCC